MEVEDVVELAQSVNTAIDARIKQLRRKDKKMACRNCDIEEFPFEIDGKFFSAHELFQMAERKYNCQAETNLKITSVACKCLSQHGHIVKDRRDLISKAL